MHAVATCHRVLEECAPGCRTLPRRNVLSDRAVFAWICDVFVLPAHRARGVSKALMREALAHPELQGLRRWMLGTAPAERGTSGKP